MTAQDTVPAALVAGDSFSFDAPAAYAMHPPPDWSLRFSLRPDAGGAPITEIAIDTGGTYRLRIAPTATAGLARGRHVWALVAVGDANADRKTLATGALFVSPDPLAAGDARSDAARILDAITARIEGRVTKDADSYSIEGRSITRTPIADLLRLRNIYAKTVARERGAAGGVTYRRIRL